MTAEMNWIHRVWHRIQEPRFITLFQTAVYLAMAVAGITSLVDPPPLVSGTLGPALTAWWGWLATLGGISGFIVCPYGIWWMEKVSIMLSGGGFAVYWFVIADLNSDYMTEQLMMVTMLILFFAARYARIRKSAYDPEK